MLHWYESQEELDKAIADLRTTGKRGLSLLWEIREHTTLKRKNVSTLISTLEDMGFLFVREGYDDVTLSVSLYGEEALDAIEELENPVSA